MLDWIWRILFPRPPIDPGNLEVLVAFIDRLRDPALRLDRSWLKTYISSEARLNGRIVLKKLESLIALADISALENAPGEIQRIGFAKEEISALSKALQLTGLAAYGLPMKELAKNDRLISPLMYQMAYGNFRLDPSDREGLRDLRGVYRLLLRETNSQFVEARLLLIDTIDARGGRAANYSGEVDARGIAVELSKDIQADGDLVARAGSFVPFDQFSVAFLASPPPPTIPVQSIFDRLANSILADDESVSQPQIRVGGAPQKYFQVITVQDLGANEIAGTYQYRQTIGKFVGIKRLRLTRGDFDNLGLLTEEKLRQLPVDERRLLERASNADFADVYSSAIGLHSTAPRVADQP